VSRRPPSTRFAALAAVAAAAAALPFVAAPSAPAAERTGRLAPDSVSITVDDVTPTVPAASTTARGLSVTLTVTNRSRQTLRDVRIEGERGEPITRQGELDRAIARVAPPSGHIVPIEPTRRVQLSLSPGARQQVIFETTTSIRDDSGLCICADASHQYIYPLYFSAHIARDGAVDQQLGIAGTFVPAFYVPPAPVRVSWVWPLVEQPHRLDDSSSPTAPPLFVDDALAAAVAPGGRLDRALAVVEDASTVPMTLLVDPETIDELQVMASSPYRVQVDSTKSIPGTGGTAAAAWLARLRTLLANNPALSMQLTPYADPDVDTLTAAGLPWQTGLPPELAARVTTALGGTLPPSTMAWPLGGVSSRPTLDALVHAGVNTVLLNSSAVTPKPPSGGVRPGLARLSVGGTDVAVGLLNSALQKLVSQGVTVGGRGTAVLPTLISELAVRAVQEPQAEHVAVLAPPRWVDPSVAEASRIIRETSSSSFAKPVSLAAAVSGELLPNGRSRLAVVRGTGPTLPPVNLAAVQQVTNDVPALSSLLTPVTPGTLDPRAAAILAELPLEGQRLASSAWSRPSSAAAGEKMARAVTAELSGFLNGVLIVTPSHSSYTLGSSNSPLPITVENNLDYPARISVDVSTVNGLPGFTAKAQTAVVDAHSKRTIHVDTKVDPIGRIQVLAQLRTPDGQRQLGSAVQMTVRNTQLGVVGVVITIVAGAVLLLALLIRFGRRWRRRRRGGAPKPRWDPDNPETAAEVAATFAADQASAT
jgi:hypothetical protein